MPAAGSAGDDRGSAADADEYLRASEVAAMFHVSARTVARWADEGMLPHVRTLGGHRRFQRSAVERLARELDGKPPA